MGERQMLPVQTVKILKGGVMLIIPTVQPRNAHPRTARGVLLKRGGLSAVGLSRRGLENVDHRNKSGLRSVVPLSNVVRHGANTRPQ